MTKKEDQVHPTLGAEIARRLNGAARGEKKGIVEEYKKTFGLSIKTIYKVAKKYAWTSDIQA